MRSHPSHKVRYRKSQCTFIISAGDRISNLGCVVANDPALNNEAFIATITGVEIIAAITRRSRSESISIKASVESTMHYLN